MASAEKNAELELSSNQPRLIPSNAVADLHNNSKYLIDVNEEEQKAV